MTIELRHRTASSTSGGWWEYDRRTRAIVVCCANRDPETRAIEDIVCVEIPVCSDANRIKDAFSLHRMNESTWCIAPARYVEHLSMFRPSVYPRAKVEDHDRGRVIEVDALARDAIVLLSAPDSVCTELAQL